jgi:Tfp pilus assembly protein PilV
MLLRPAALRSGVSLLEVLGATAIFLMSIVAIGELMSLSTDQAIDVQHRSRATRLCQSKLNEFTAGVELVTGATSGQFEEEPEFNWQAEVTSETTAINLYRVRVTVTRETPGGAVEVSMTQLVYDPQQRGQLTAGTPASSTPADSAEGTPGGAGMTGGSGMTGGQGNQGGSGMSGGNRPGGNGAFGFGGGPKGPGGFNGGNRPPGGTGFGGGPKGPGGNRPGGFGGGNGFGGGAKR